MPTDCLFREDAYLTSTPATVLGLTEKGGIVVDRTCFYATSGGQPGDSGMLVTPAGEFPLATAVYNDALKTEIAHVPAEGVSERPNAATPSRSSSTGACATAACACTPRCISSPPCCPIR